MYFASFLHATFSPYVVTCISALLFFFLPWRSIASFIYIFIVFIIGLSYPVLFFDQFTYLVPLWCNWSARVVRSQMYVLGMRCRWHRLGWKDWFHRSSLFGISPGLHITRPWRLSLESSHLLYNPMQKKHVITRSFEKCYMHCQRINTWIGI